ncbi:hypothetical protein EHI8A_044580 [Entamoeba histolytica HM-1:IMSS-B]|uniref:Uncharacterized protein n=6 Tax=Entamoeba histolytica TaxID=5759 RepID=C4LST5_ENTH1|nr:hypothetical protein EHI_152480 [Entamoeba histolytica HM-1:IMSS]EMD49276.1 Hypothetical protein EHI5A_000790 [Entamoeba histolytica KU27]EMH77703.1 hypothetical protein EHI8A_044580 [Entamoeba histolytica HM-1:IMSS-B]EMS10816.1 hypothetical protein KM1_002100 [Entamoeba histolytica HM-3:IMSS]ENY61910.1 hypothetical protein EHI7A_018640 [Entamoeba histolytica HM-1:IMSS-A]GAT91501.1 hypothetical protein CL6EHI_152480 [Entamoeba histolytica]|eukprot:XP_656963.1 hypothetical protein EHI_152480 [Entamoeba histolytica HM-1:IMSS]
MLPINNYTEIKHCEHITSVSFSEKRGIPLRIGYSIFSNFVTNCFEVIEFSNLTNSFNTLTNSFVVNKILPCSQVLFLENNTPRDCFVVCGECIGLYAIEENKDPIQSNKIVDLYMFRGSDELFPAVSIDQMRNEKTRLVSCHLDDSVSLWSIHNEGVFIIRSLKVQDLTCLSCSMTDPNLYFMSTKSGVIQGDWRDGKNTMIIKDEYQYISTNSIDSNKMCCAKGNSIHIFDLRKTDKPIRDVNIENQIQSIQWKSESLFVITSKGVILMKEQENKNIEKKIPLEGSIGIDQSIVYPSWISIFTENKLVLYNLNQL